jgi:outer membrane protein assembly factor BamE (lipoprotein component of BamABCDE complex)
MTNQWRRVIVMSWMAGLAGVLAGCDFVAQQELKVGESSIDDVRKLMGKPDMIWEEKDGSQVLEYPRAPAGTETLHVKISPEGKYQGMKNILTRDNFAKIQPGMSYDSVRQILGRATEVVEFRMKQEVVWSYRHMADPGRRQLFNVHFDAEGKVKTTSTSEDPPQGQG